MSSVRSRRGGSSKGMTLRRKRRSGRKCAALDLALRAACSSPRARARPRASRSCRRPARSAALRARARPSPASARSCRRPRRGRASRRRPARTCRASAAVAPVNAPRTWPNSSDSISSSGTAEQFSSTKGARARASARVDGARDQLLARARLAVDEHAPVGRRDQLDLLAERAHRHRLADHRPLVAQLLGERRVDALQPALPRARC